MAFKSYRERSKENWGSEGNAGLSLEQIRTGAILRIADATEAMAKEYNRILSDMQMYKRWYEERGARIEKLERRIRGLRGWITKLLRGHSSPPGARTH